MASAGTGHMAVGEDESASMESYEEAVASESLARDVPRGRIDALLLTIVATLVGIGILVVYTGSAVDAFKKFGDDMIFVRQQIGGAVAGMLVMLAAVRIDYRVYRRYAPHILFVTFFLLMLIWVPGFGVEVKGARRWLNLIFIRFQPAELAKVAICIFMAYSMEKRADHISNAQTFLLHAIPVGMLVLPLFVQPDFGSTVIVCAMAGVMLLMGGVRLIHGVMVGVIVIPVGVFAFVTESYRVARFHTWLNPWENQSGTSYQLIHGWVALANGGLEGTGFGQGNSIFGYIPEMYNDWAAALIGEEFGFIGLLVFMALYAIFAWRGYRIAAKCDDRFGALLAFAITTLVVGQAGFNLGVVTGLLPTKGLTLPFVSFGRSSLVMMLFAVGILLNISQNNPDLSSENSLRRAFRDRLWGRDNGEAVWRGRRLRELGDGVNRDV